MRLVNVCEARWRGGEVEVGGSLWEGDVGDSIGDECGSGDW